MPQRAHSHRQHSPTRATTQEFLMFIRHPEPQLKRCHSDSQLNECQVLNPYLEPQLKRYVPSHNSRNTSKSTFEVSSKPCRPCTSKAITTLLLHSIAWGGTQGARRIMLPNRLAGDTCRKAPSTSRHRPS